MSLTEVVFELADPRHPVGRLTAEQEGCRGVYRFVETDGPVTTAALTVLGPPDRAAGLARELQSGGHYEEVVLASLAPYAAVFRLRRRVGEPHPDGPAPVERMLDVFGPDTIFEPLFVERGRWRCRAILVEPMETRRVLATLGGLHRAMGWQEFRTLRVAAYGASQYANALRRVLEPEQEDLLRLAVDLGYYETPKRCTLQDIAGRVGLSVSPVHKRLKAIEQALVVACVQPQASKTQAPPRRARPQVEAREARPGEMTEVHVRILWPGLALARYSEQFPAAQVVLQPLAEPDGGPATSLVIVLGGARETREASEALVRRPGVEAVDVVGKDADHVTLKVRWRADRLLGEERHMFPTNRFLRRVGRDACLRPTLLGNGEVFMRAVLTHPTGVDEVRERLAALAEEAGWKDWALLDHRPLGADPALVGPPADRLTPRQLEILKIAHALGYYKTPRSCTLDDVARTLGISANAIHKNLTAGEQKIVASYLAGCLPS